MWILRFLSAATVALVGSLVQAQPQEAPQFEVVSIKRSAHGARGPTFYNPTPARFELSSITAKSLIGYAYDVREFQVSGGPSWLDSDEYDIVAKPQGDIRGERILAMTRNLLRDRFQLNLHRESKELSVLELVTAKGGAKLNPSVAEGLEVRGGEGRFMARKITMRMMAAQLAGRVLGRPVLDRTGIAGEFDVDLEWTPDESSDTGPSIFTALQEQLGLRLQSARGPVEMLVIDHVERPSEN
jgi:uncharacterized protein (TIGR03435 family)